LASAAPLSEIVNLQHFVAIVVNDLDGDLAGSGGIKWKTLCRVEFRPSSFVDFGSKCSLELFIRFIGSAKISVADEEGLLVVVRVDEPTGYVIRAKKLPPF